MHKTYVHVCVWACTTSRYPKSVVGTVGKPPQTATNT